MHMQPAVTQRTEPTSAPPLLSLAALYTEHASFVWKTLLRLGVPERDIEDEVQETFVVLHRKLAEFEHRSSVKTWVFAVARRVASDWREKAHVRRETDLGEAPERTTSNDTATAAIARKQAPADPVAPAPSPRDFARCSRRSSPEQAGFQPPKQAQLCRKMNARKDEQCRHVDMLGADASLRAP